MTGGSRKASLKGLEDRGFQHKTFGKARRLHHARRVARILTQAKET